MHHRQSSMINNYQSILLIDIYSYLQENGLIPQSPVKIIPSPDAERPVTLLQSNVEKLAAALANRVTIKVSPENGSR